VKLNTHGDLPCWGAAVFPETFTSLQERKTRREASWQPCCSQVRLACSSSMTLHPSLHSLPAPVPVSQNGSLFLANRVDAGGILVFGKTGKSRDNSCSMVGGNLHILSFQQGLDAPPLSSLIQPSSFLLSASYDQVPSDGGIGI